MALFSASQATKGLAGGAVPISDLTDTRVTTAAEKAVEAINKASNSVYKTMLVEITGGTVQVVQGMKYVLTLRVGRSSHCRNDGKPATPHDCPVSEDSMETWKATVWVRVWLSPEERYQVTDLERVDTTVERVDTEVKKVDATVEKQPPEPRLVGAPIPLEDTTDAEVVAAANVAVGDLNMRSNSLQKLVLVEVHEGTVQVVNGAKYSLTFSVGLSKCKKDGKPATVKTCPVIDGTLEKWHAVVMRHPINPPTYDLLQLDKVR